MDNLKEIKTKYEELGKLIAASEAKQPKFCFADIVKSKKEKIEKFAAAVQAGKDKELKTVLNNAGFLRGSFALATGATTWGAKAKPGYRIKIEAGKFSVTYHEKIEVDRQPIEGLNDYLTKNK